MRKILSSLVILLMLVPAAFALVTPQVKDFAIYVDTGTWEPSIVAFENLLTTKGLTWQEIDGDTINANNLSQYYKGLWIPGGWAYDYKRDISDVGDAHIRSFLQDGGSYSGASAGAYYACDDIHWEGKDYEYTLDIFFGQCIGPVDDIAPWPDYVMTTMNVNQSMPANVYEPAQRSVLYYGEPYFIPDAGQEMIPMANYIVPSDPAADNQPGIIGFNYGNGRAILYGPHLEVDEDSDRDGTSFGDELSDGPDGSDWPFMWTGIDWMLKQNITQMPSGEVEINDTEAPTIGSVNDMPDPVTSPANITIEADVMDNFGVKTVLAEFDGANHTMKQDIASEQSQLFFDGFESGVFSTSWTRACQPSGCAPWGVFNTSSYQGTKSAQSKAAGAGKNATLTLNLSTEGHLNITVRYYRQLVGLDSVDSYSAYWYNGTKWQLLEQKADGGGSANDPAYVYKSFALDGTASDNTDFKVKFTCEAGAVSEFCRVDNFEVLGTGFTSMWRYSQSTSGLSAGAHSYAVHASDFKNNTAISSGHSFTVN